MRIHGVAIFFAVVAMAGCSNRQVYDAALSSQRIQCSKLPEWQYSECMDRAGKSYDEYQREREEARKM